MSPARSIGRLLWGDTPRVSPLALATTTALATSVVWVLRHPSGPTLATCVAAGLIADLAGGVVVNSRRPVRRLPADRASSRREAEGAVRGGRRDARTEECSWNLGLREPSPPEPDDAESNLTQSTHAFYRRRPALRWVFIAVHVQPLALGWLTGEPLWAASSAWAVGVGGAAAVNALGGDRAIGGAAVVTGLGILHLLPLSQPMAETATLFLVKLAYAFAVDHSAGALSAAEADTALHPGPTG